MSSKKIIIKEKDAQDIIDSLQNFLKQFDGNDDEHKMILIEFLLKEQLKLK